jgi:hypothetical protein
MTLKKSMCLAALAGVLSLGFIAVSPSFSQQAAVAPQRPNVTAEQLTREQMETFLTTARIIADEPAGKGITKTRRLTLTDGRYVHYAHLQDIDIYKAEYKTKEGIEKNFRDSYKFNIAAYRVDRIMDLQIVPVCVPRRVNGKEVALDWWVDNVQFDEEGRRDKKIEPPDPNYWTRQLNTVRDFDQLIYNEDRNQGNLLIDTNWKLWAIDHSRAFRSNTTVRDPKVLRRVSNKMMLAMKNLNAQVLRDNLLPYITEENIQGLLARRDFMINFFESEISSKGQDAILTDMPRKTPQVTIP